MGTCLQSLVSRPRAKPLGLKAGLAEKSEMAG